MIAIPIPPEPALLRPAPPALVAPAPRQVSFGLVEGRVNAGTVRIAVFVDGAEIANRSTPRGRFRLRVPLPTRDVTVKVVAYGPAGRSSDNDSQLGLRTSAGGPSDGDPRPARPRAPAAAENTQWRLSGNHRLLRPEPPDGRGRGVERPRTLPGRLDGEARDRDRGDANAVPACPPRAAEVDRLLRSMLQVSSNRAANELLVWLGGSTGAGAARVNATLRQAGITDTELYGGYVVGTGFAAGKPIPVGVVESPSFGVGKYTTAWDMARMFKYLHLATAGSRTAGGPPARIHVGGCPAPALLPRALAGPRKAGSLRPRLGSCRPAQGRLDLDRAP